ncbi:hypothetical protein Tco_0154699 [Tanacetum coccineum]
MDPLGGCPQGQGTPTVTCLIPDHRVGRACSQYRSHGASAPGVEYHAPSDDDIQVEDQPYADDASPLLELPWLHRADSDSMEEDTDEDSINYLDEPIDGEEDDDDDPEEDPSEEHEP